MTVPEVVQAFRPTIDQSTVLADENHGVCVPVRWLKRPSELNRKSAIVMIATDEAIDGK